jgi:hypothetical protein
LIGFSTDAQQVLDRLPRNASRHDRATFGSPTPCTNLGHDREGGSACLGGREPFELCDLHLTGF